MNVTCKPKHVYPSYATNCVNDLTFIRYMFNEHEMSRESSQEEGALSNE